MTAATIQTAASGSRIQIDSTDGLQIFSGSTVVFHGDLSGNVDITGSLVSGPAGGLHIEINKTILNALTVYRNDGTESGRFSSIGLLTNNITGYGTVIVADNSTNQSVTLGGSTVVIRAGGNPILTVAAGTVTVAGGSVFAGSGANLTSLSGSNISSGTVAAAYIDAAIARTTGVNFGPAAVASITVVGGIITAIS